MKIIYFNRGLKKEYVNDHSCYEHNLTRSENKALSCTDLFFFSAFTFTTDYLSSIRSCDYHSHIQKFKEMAFRIATAG